MEWMMEEMAVFATNKTNAKDSHRLYSSERMKGQSAEERDIVERWTRKRRNSAARLFLPVTGT